MKKKKEKAGRASFMKREVLVQETCNRDNNIFTERIIMDKFTLFFLGYDVIVFFF